MGYSAEQKLDALKSLGARLAIVRGDQRRTQNEFAKRFDISPRAYHDFERGKRAPPADLLIRISEEFDINLNWLMRGMETSTLSGYEQQVEDFVSSLHKYIDQTGDKLSPEAIAAMTSRWIGEFRKGREVSLNDVHIWIDLLRKA